MIPAIWLSLNSLVARAVDGSKAICGEWRELGSLTRQSARKPLKCQGMQMRLSFSTRTNRTFV